MDVSSITSYQALGRVLQLYEMIDKSHPTMPGLYVERPYVEGLYVESLYVERLYVENRFSDSM